MSCRLRISRLIMRSLLLQGLCELVSFLPMSKQRTSYIDSWMETYMVDALLISLVYGKVYAVRGNSIAA